MPKTSIGTLKREVKSLFKGNWLTAVKITFIPALITALVSIILWITASFVIFLFRQTGSSLWTTFMQGSQQDTTSHYSLIWNIISSLVMILLYIGVKYTFLDWLRAPETGVEHPFMSTIQGFSTKVIGSLIALAILTHLFTYLWSLLLLIPGLIMSYAYRMVYFIYKDHQETHYGFLELITLSKAMMKGYKWQLFCLDLSFIGWFVLSIIFAGIPLFWVMPYYQATVAAFYKDLATRQASENV